MGRKKTFNWGKTSARVIYICQRGKIIGTLSKKHVVYYDGPSKKYGHLKDGRPVVYKDGKWIYIVK